MSTTTTRRGGRQRTLRPGIYADAHGITGLFRSKGTTVWQRRYALDADLDRIEADRLHAIADWKDGQTPDVEPRRRAATAATLATDVPAFLATLPDGGKKKDFSILLAHWAQSPLGALPRATITRTDVVRQLAEWENADVAIVTRNHRLRALRGLYFGLDGIDAPNPTDRIKMLPPPEAEPRGIPMWVVETILAQLPDRGRGERFGTRPTVSHTKIRLTVIAWTGMPHMQLERLPARNVDLVTGTVQYPPRRKGKGAKGSRVALLPQAIAAFRAFDAAGLWQQPFSRSSMRKTWAVALKRTAQYAAATHDRALLEALRQLPIHCRPYDLRHAFLTEAYRKTGDLRTVKELGQHADIKTTERYTEGAVSERVAAAIAAMREANPMPPATPPAPAAAAPRAPRPFRLVPGGRTT